MVSRKRDTYQIEQRTDVLFMFELDYECKIFKKNSDFKMLYAVTLVRCMERFQTRTFSLITKINC